MSSGAYSSAGFRGAAGRRRGDSRVSPVVYRENQMAYEPDKSCECNPPRKAPRWISWSVLNPGRRYYACVDAMNGRGCGYVEWHDPPVSKFLSELVGDLRDEVWRLRAQQNGPRSDEDRAKEAMLQDLQQQVKQKTAEIAAMKGKFERIVMAVVVFVVGLVAGKFVSG